MPGPSSPFIYLLTQTVFDNQVTGIRKTSVSSSTKWILSVEGDSSAPEIAPYDHVIIATPFASSAITILGSPAAQTLLQPAVEFVRLHVTLLATTSPGPRPEYFNLRAGASVPFFVTTTWDAVRHGDATTPKPEFNSLNYLNQIKNIEEHGIDEWTVKIFSQEKISDEWLANVFGEGKVGWVYRKEVCFPILLIFLVSRLT